MYHDNYQINMVLALSWIFQEMTNSPIRPIRPVYKDKVSTLKVQPAVCEVEQRRVVEPGVGLLVHVDVPVLVVLRHRRRRVDAGEEGGVRQVEAAHAEVGGDGVAHLVTDLPE